MQNDVNQSKRIFLKATRQWVEVSSDFYRDYMRDIDTFRKRQQSHGQCFCPKRKFWLCDADCYNCEFQATGDVLSLDAPGADTPDASPLLNIIPDPQDYKAAVEDSILLQQLFERLRELDPHADAIIKLWIDDPDISDRAIARNLNIPQRTFADRMKRIRAELRKLLE